MKKQLLGRLHDLARKQIGFEPAPVKDEPSPPNASQGALNGSRTNGSNGKEPSHTGMTEVADAVSATFTDQ